MAVRLSVGRVSVHFSSVIRLRPVLRTNTAGPGDLLCGRSISSVFMRSRDRRSHVATSLLLIKASASSRLYCGVCTCACDLKEKLQKGVISFPPLGSVVSC